MIGINTNITALRAAGQLSKTLKLQEEAALRISSGLRINSARDDAAGLGIATRMDSQIRGMNVAIRNTNDGISLAQTADSATSSMIDNLQRMRELAVQSKNETLSADDRTQLDKEFQALASEIKRSVDSANFNGVNILDGTKSSFNIQVGAGTTTNDTVEVETGDLTTLNSYGALDITTTANSSNAVDKIDLDIKSVNSLSAGLGAAQNRLNSVVNQLNESIVNVSASKGRIMDADFAQETAKLTRAQILQQAGTAMLSQSNIQSQNILKLLGI